MKNLIPAFTFALMFFSLSARAQEPMRTWTDKENRTMEARMLSSEPATVTVMTPRAVVHIIRLDTLSEADQAYVRERQGAARNRRGAASSGAREAAWHTDMDKAKEEAARLNLPIFMLFTGSDWCPPCMNLEKNVLGKREFQNFADENLVLLMVDFPRRKSLPARQKKANDALASTYGVRGYPTMLLTDAEGKTKQRLGYGGQDAKGFTEMLQGKL